MAGDWIKMRVSLWTHPKVVTLSSRLSVTRAHAVGALQCAWCIADQHADENGVVEMGGAALDSLCETPGLADALVAVGWLRLNEGSLQFLNYQEHNGTTGKQRATAQRRQKLSRSCHGPVTVETNKIVTREEKRREENKEETPYPLSLDTPEFREAWKSWQTHRREIRKKLTPTTEAKQLKALAAMGLSRAIRCIEHTIEKGWMGLREPDAAFVPVNGKPSVDYINAQMAAKYGSHAKAGGA